MIDMHVRERTYLPKNDDELGMRRYPLFTAHTNERLGCVSGEQGR